MENLEAVARAAGSSLADTVRFGVFLRDLSDLAVVNEVFEDLLSPPYPARTTVQSNLTRFDVEVDAVLYAPSSAA
jgi:2-iminobutanoate/2-iminopropanoate deaminase